MHVRRTIEWKMAFGQVFAMLKLPSFFQVLASVELHFCMIGLRTVFRWHLLEYWNS